MKGANPIINTHSIFDFYNENKDGLNMKTTNQRFAISFFNSYEVKPLFDEEYVKLVATYVVKTEDGKEVRVDQPVHDCTEEDWAQFHPPDIDTKTYIKQRALEYGAEEKDVRATFKCLDIND